MELRKDYVLNRYVIVAPVRGSRPYDFSQKIFDDQSEKVCYFCPGNEQLASAEKGHIGEPWKIRWFDNKYPALEPTGKSVITTDNTFFTFSDAYGYHEVIVETNEHWKQLFDFSERDMKELLEVYKQRIEDLSAKEHIAYVHVFKNHGREAGTSIRHTHTQIMALNHIPHLIAEELAAVAAYERCPYCDILNIEKTSHRRCFENAGFVAFTPYASRFNYELWIFPKKHYLSITELDGYELFELADILKKALLKLRDVNVSYNLFIHNSPQPYIGSGKRGLHFHIEITPRIDLWGGFEHGSESYINRITPEDAARFYRGE